MISTLLSPLAALFGGAVRARADLYRRGWLRSDGAGVPVLSVGNLVAGGTGKTPVAALVARILHRAGLRPAVLSRGYGGRRDEDPLVVSDGDPAKASVTAERAGDEPAMLARLLPGIPVVVARRRPEGAHLAVTRLGARSLVLDDGFQHLALRRSFDLVLLDAARPFDNGRLLPAGLLRESPRALARASAIAMTGDALDRSAGEDPRAAGAPVSRAPEEPVTRWTIPGTPVFHVTMTPTLVVSGDDPGKRPGPIADLRDGRWFAGRSVVAFAGIARPHRLARDLVRLGADVRTFLPYPDHHAYTRDDVRKILEAVASAAPDTFLTTEKDLARLRGAGLSAPLVDKGLVALRVEATLSPKEAAAFDDLVIRAGGGALR